MVMSWIFSMMVLTSVVCAVIAGTGAELAAEHNRSKGAIAARLVKLGVISFRDELK